MNGFAGNLGFLALKVFAVAAAAIGLVWWLRAIARGAARSPDGRVRVKALLLASPEGLIAMVSAIVIAAWVLSTESVWRPKARLDAPPVAIEAPPVEPAHTRAPSAEIGAPDPTLAERGARAAARNAAEDAAARSAFEGLEPAIGRDPVVPAVCAERAGRCPDGSTPEHP